MARMFTGSDAIVYPSVLFKTLYDNAFSFWWRPTFDQNDGQDHYVYECQMHYGGYILMRFAKWADNRLGAGMKVNLPPYWSDYSFYAEANHYTLLQNQWNSVVHVFGGSYNKIYLNGVFLGEGPGGLNPTSLYSMTIGNNLSRTASASGALGEMAILGREFSAEQVKSHTFGENPHNLGFVDIGYYSYGLSNYFPLWGLHNPEPNLIQNRLPGFVYGTTVFRPGPPVMPYSNRWWKNQLAYPGPFVPPAPPAPGGISGVIVVPDEGEVIAQQVMLGAAAPEDLWLRLFTNDYYPNELTNRNNFVEPGSHYGPHTLTKNVDWTFTAGSPTPSEATSWSRTFDLTGPVGMVYGYWVEGKVSRKVYWALRYTYPIYVGSNGGEVIVVPHITATTA